MQISIHAVLLDRDVQVFACFDLVDISIHAVLWDRDGKQVRKEYTGDDISIHAVLWDRDASLTETEVEWRYFNPRGPLGPRHRPYTVAAGCRDFNPRGPLGPRHAKRCL